MTVSFNDFFFHPKLKGWFQTLIEINFRKNSWNVLTFYRRERVICATFVRKSTLQLTCVCWHIKFFFEKKSWKITFTFPPYDYYMISMQWVLILKWEKKCLLIWNNYVDSLITLKRFWNWWLNFVKKIFQD